MNHADNATQFVADREQTRWHDQALWFIRAKRDVAARSLPEWETLRSLASQIKQHTIGHLDTYLRQFEHNAVAAGAHVHWARNASELNETVLGILRDRGVTEVVKSKSMLTEECGLNEFLASQSIQVTDTDLGEWIVQLRDEPPSHIVLPAIHIRKEQVGQLFHEHLGTPAGESDPTRLTEAARQRLRQFLIRAGAGITGVNFAIAETGGIVVCTNEGNADLGTALPPLHIACMGIEKLIPRLADLGVLIRLLARSATGQPITSYSTHFRGPRPDSELHVVLLDNGRSRLRASPDHQSSLTCIRCGACLNTCPVYRRSGGHSYETTIAGPIGSILHTARDLRTHASLPYACSLCGSCRDICPVRIDLPNQLLALRQAIAGARGARTTKRWPMWIGTRILMHPKVYQWTFRIVRWLLRHLPRFVVQGRWNIWSRQRELPLTPRQSFHDEYQRSLRRHPNDGTS